VDAVGDFDANRITSRMPDAAGADKFTSAAYKRDAQAAVMRLTRRRVTSFISSHDPDTDVATEVFKLEQRAFA
jgi:hypothetical protein